MDHHSIGVIVCVFMTRLAASDNALGALLLLSQRPEGLRVSEVADALGISFTGAEKALDILVADHLVSRPGRRYLPVDSARTREAVRFTLALLRPDEALAALARANPAVEFCGIDAKGVLVVIGRFAEPVDEARLHQALESLQEFHPDARIELASKGGLRDQLLEDLAPRRRASRMQILVGSVDRTFPDRTRQSDFDAQHLGRLNPLVVPPSQRRLRELAREHHLRRILAFGSATRADFRPDSDLDLLVEPAPGRELGLSERVDLMVEAERLFGRDVDLLAAPIRRQSLAERVMRDAVVLYDASR